MDEAARTAWATSRPGADHAVDAACIAPWVSLELDPAGIVYACCANLLYPLGRIGTDRLSDLWDGPRARVLKDALLNWDLSVGCAGCRWHLDHGRVAPEMAIYDPFPLTTPDPAGPVSMTFALSNRCNLACAMCTPELSSTIRHRAGLPRLHSPYDDQFFVDLAGFLPGLRHAKFLGGEPFLIPEHHRVWDLLTETGATPRLHVTTNGTVWNDRVERLLGEFVVDLSISVDAASAETYESVRDGAKFDDVRANIDRFVAMSRERGAHVQLNFCLIPETADELHPMLEWGDQLDVPVHTIVVTDDGFAVHALPDEDLERIARQWEADGARALGRNAAEWETQVRQLEAVRDDRRSGALPVTGQAFPATRDFLTTALDGLPPSDGSTHLDVEVQRLSDWASGGPVAVCTVGPDSQILRVVAPHPRLGITGAVEGTHTDRLLDVMEAADGRTAWAIEAVVVRPGLVVRGVVLSAERPARGAAGAVVRIVCLTDDGTDYLLAAEDRFYDLPDEVPVDLSTG